MRVSRRSSASTRTGRRGQIEHRRPEASCCFVCDGIAQICTGYVERASTGGDPSSSSRILHFPSEGPRQALYNRQPMAVSPDDSMDKVFTCGCGHLSAELLCSLLLHRGIASVLDIRELDPEA